MDNPNILAIIPAFNEEKAIGPVVRELRQQEIDVLVIDDGSTDNTANTAEQAGAKVARLPVNLGYGVALQTGYIFAKRHPQYKAVVQLDGDGQHTPGDVGTLLEPVLNGKADMVMGSRFLGEGNYVMPWPRRFGQRIFSAMIKTFTGKSYSDPTTGFAALSRRTVQLFSTDIFPDDFPDADMLVILHRAGLKTLEKPVSMKQNDRKSMHSGVIKPCFYVLKMTLAIIISTLVEIKEGN